MIKCILASLVTGRFVSGVAPSCRSQVVLSRACVFVLWIVFNETVSSSYACPRRMDVLGLP